MSCALAAPAGFIGIVSLAILISPAKGEVSEPTPGTARQSQSLEAFRFTDRPHYYGGCGYPDHGSLETTSAAVRPVEDDVIPPFFYSDYDYNVYDYGSPSADDRPVGKLHCVDAVHENQTTAAEDSEPPFVADGLAIGSGLSAGGGTGLVLDPSASEESDNDRDDGDNLYHSDLRTGYDEAYDAAMSSRPVEPGHRVQPASQQSTRLVERLVSSEDVADRLAAIASESRLAAVARRTLNGHYWRSAVVEVRPTERVTTLDDQRADAQTASNGHQFLFMKAADTLDHFSSAISDAADHLRNWAVQDDFTWVAAPDPLDTSL